MNQINLIGRVVAEPEEVQTERMTILRFRLAVQRSYKRGDGTRAADFFVCECQEKMRRTVEFMDKGMLCRVTGAMESYALENEGKKTTYWKVVVKEIEFLGDKRGEDE